MKKLPLTEERNQATLHIDKATTEEMIAMMNEANRRSVEAVAEASAQIAKAADAAAKALAAGGRIIYVGAGTSGRLAVTDAAECPPTFGVDYETVSAVIAGGTRTLVHAAEGEEDSAEAGRADILAKNLTAKDMVMGISASGGAAYVAAALKAAKEIGCTTVSLSSNQNTRIAAEADIEIFTDTGAEVITGSTRLKAGNAQKMVLNMISTVAMIKTGKVYENMMINLRPTNIKLRDRVIRILVAITGQSYTEAEATLEAHNWSLRESADAVKGK